MTKILILGAGKIGRALARMLLEGEGYDISLCDSNDAFQKNLDQAITPYVLDVTCESDMAPLFKAHDYVLSALPFFLNPEIARWAARYHVHYFDLTEDVATAEAVREASIGSDRVFMPQCGLAPGFISIVAQGLVKRFEQAYDVHLRVGALPQFPDNALKYNLTWSTDGLINEYCNPCNAIHEGEKREVLALEGLEHFTLDGISYEAFNTSGGLGSLCDSLEGKVRNLNYKTVRYPGHRDMMKMMCKDLRLCERREVFRDIVDQGIPVTHQDVVLIFVTITGLKEGRLAQDSYVKKIYADGQVDGFSAIQKTTSAGICALMDLHHTGALKSSGFVSPGDVALDQFLSNRFGQVYA